MQRSGGLDVILEHKVATRTRVCYEYEDIEFDNEFSYLIVGICCNARPLDSQRKSMNDIPAS